LKRLKGIIVTTMNILWRCFASPESNPYKEVERFSYTAIVNR